MTHDLICPFCKLELNIPSLEPSKHLCINKDCKFEYEIDFVHDSQLVCNYQKLSWEQYCTGKYRIANQWLYLKTIQLTGSVEKDGEFVFDKLECRVPVLRSDEEVENFMLMS